MILDRFRLTDQVAIVTGSGRGIGRGIALGFAEAGAAVVLCSRTASEIDAVAEEVRAAGGRALAVPCDVNDEAQVQAVIDRALAELGRIDVLVNNAGGTMPCLALHLTAEELDAAFHFNVTSAFVFSRQVVPHLIERGGVILNISSALSHVVEPGFVAYGATKAALSHLSRLLACELAPRVRVNALAVGAVATDALGMFLAADEVREQMERLHPMGRVGQVEDIAAAALYLCSPAASWVTGKVFEIDGGAPGSTWPSSLRLSAF